MRLDSFLVPLLQRYNVQPGTQGYSVFAPGNCTSLRIEPFAGSRTRPADGTDEPASRPKSIYADLWATQLM
jgi:hypothetical protein